jgi:hypothetical protein
MESQPQAIQYLVYRRQNKLLALGQASVSYGTGAPLVFVAPLPPHPHEVTVEAGLPQALVHHVVYLTHPQLQILSSRCPRGFLPA